MFSLIVLSSLGMTWMLFSKFRIFIHKSILLPFSVLMIFISTFLDYLIFPTLGSVCSPFLIFNDHTFIFSSLVNFVTAVFLYVVVSDFLQKGKNVVHPVSLLLFSTFGANIMIASTHFMALFLGVEILSIPIYGLVSSYYNSTKSQEAGLKYFLMGSFISTFLLLGISLFYAGTAGFQISLFSLNFFPQMAPLLLVGVTLIVGSMIFKLGVVPFQFWIADVYEGCPSSVLGWMTTIVKITIMGVLLLCLTPLFTLPIMGLMLITIPAILSVIFGNFLAFFQTKLKRWIAYSGIAHLGYMFFAFSPISTSTHFALIIYLITYVISSLIFFVSLYCIERKMGHSLDTLQEFKGLYYRFPLLSIIFSLGLLSFAGFPPLPGFFGKLLILMHLVSFQEIGLICVAILGFLIGVFNYLKLVLSLFDFSES